MNHNQDLGHIGGYLIEITPEVYEKYVVYKDNTKFLDVQMYMVCYDRHFFYYKTICIDIEEIGYLVNLYDPCVAHRIVNGKQQTVTWHVDDLKSSHMEQK